MAPSRSTVREKLQKYSFVRTWADRSETVVALRNASLGKVSLGCLSFACCQCARIFVAWLEFFHGLIGVVYTLFVQPFWLALVDHCRLRRFRAIRWCHGDASTSFPSSNGLHEPLTFEKSTEWSSQSSSRLRSKPFGAAVRSECSKYPRRVMCVHCMLLFHCECLCASTFRSKFARLGKSMWGLVLESVRCTVVLTKQVHCLCALFAVLITLFHVCLYVASQVILWVKSSKNEKNPFKDFETWSDFYFSQRMITALISRLVNHVWLQLCNLFLTPE